MMEGERMAKLGLEKCYQETMNKIIYTDDGVNFF